MYLKMEDSFHFTHQLFMEIRIIQLESGEENWRG